ncbi:EscU/YscU/HrcU family type III secretion system export apparatus switch protein [Brassicibacter mesophilus]|uniref:EscU/YscU/HrcU family type III secretion system export apparatus switch protein n=1 Tax=Brassicibacter mesophilus TaxID=745119 RepID=UPI003D1A0B9A
MKDNYDKKIAVALKYDEEKNHAPKILAKGKGIVADNIIEKGKTEGVKLVENKQLAQELSTLNIDQEIPEHLYRAVAEILSFIYNLDSMKDDEHA